MAWLTCLMPASAEERGFNFQAATGYAREGKPFTELIRVWRSVSSLPAATLELVTADGTAKAGLDYTAVKTNLTFAAGQSQQLVQIPLLNDALIEGEETFSVRLQNPVAYPWTQPPCGPRSSV